MYKLWTILNCLINAAVCVLAMGTQAQAGASLEPDWRISRAVAAPWAPAKVSQRGTRPRVGQLVTFHQDSVDGPSVLRCGHAVLESTSYLADGLFQGSLPAPAAAAAQILGIVHLPLAGVRLTCDTGVFEFHRVDAATLLLGLDNQVLTLSHTPGALANADKSESRVQGLLEAHFASDMGFAPASVKAKRTWLSSHLKQAIARYFARPEMADEVPAVDGDPFTDSQEYPKRFAVGKALVLKDAAQVPVHFTDGFRDRTVEYDLLRDRGTWRLNDLRYEGGATLLDLLK
jgi:hypothetical protein